MIGLKDGVELRAVNAKPRVGPPLLAGVGLSRSDQQLIGVNPVSRVRERAKSGLGQQESQRKPDQIQQHEVTGAAAR
jgi:hypothetical protein